MFGWMCLYDASWRKHMNWLVGSRGNITLSFCGVLVLDDDDRKTVPTPLQILAMPCYGSNGVVHVRSIYLFEARRIHVTHGLCDAERPDKAPLGLMLKFNVCGNRPESNRLCGGCLMQKCTLRCRLGFSGERVSNRSTMSNSSSNALGCVEVFCVATTMVVLRDAAVASHSCG